MNEVENNVIKASFYAKQFAATNNEGAIGNWPKNDDYGLAYDFTFSCDKPVLVDTVSVEADGPLKDVKTVPDNGIDPTTAILGDGITDDHSYGHPILAQRYDGGGDADAVEVLDPATTIKVNGHTLVNTNFEVSEDNNVAYIQPKDFELMHLNPGQTLKFKTEVNFRAYTDIAHEDSSVIKEHYNIKGGDSDDLVIPYYPENGMQKVSVTNTTSIDTFANLTNGNSTQLERFDFNIFKVNVDYISLSGSNAECALSLPDDPTVYPKKDTLLINLATTGDGLIKNFEAMVDCNDKPTRIVGNELKASHTVSASAVAASNLEIEAGGESMTFKLSSGETLTGDTTKSLSFDSGTIKISGQVPQVSGVLLSLTYHTATGNTCSIVTQ